MIGHCIKDESQTFLNNDYIKCINVVQSSHIIYDNLLHLRLDGVSPVEFNHHNSKNEEICNAYKRRCDRFLNIKQIKIRIKSIQVKKCCTYKL